MRTQLMIRRIARWFSFLALAVPMLLAIAHIVHMRGKWDKATMCLAENIYHEARGSKHPQERALVGLITIARAIDRDRQWPKTICGVVAQEKQFSWTLDHKLATAPKEQKAWREAQTVAAELLVHAFAKLEYSLPRGWACARFFKRADDKGVSERGKKDFAARIPLGPMGEHMAYRDKRGCVTPMPTRI